jgi:probable F420-dependent oxidoreductase
LPKEYYDAMDPFVSLSAVASVTRTLKLGTGVCLIIQRDTIQTAKLVASLDHVSEGRFLFGIGGGWNQDEMEDHGTDFKTRFGKMTEQVAAMKAIWTQTKPSFEGRFVKFPPMMAWPKPVQKPHPPVIVGGAFPFAAKRAIAYGDGWIPHKARPQYGDVADFLPEFRRMAQDAGRDPASIPITIWGATEDADVLRRYQDLGVSRVVVSLPSKPADVLLPRLDRWAALIAAVR